MTKNVTSFFKTSDRKRCLHSSAASYYTQLLSALLLLVSVTSLVIHLQLHKNSVWLGDLISQKKNWNLFVAISQLTGAIGPYIPSLLFKFGLGRRLVTSIINICSIIFWVILAFMNVKTFWMGFVMRVLQGFMLGAFSALGPLLLLEVAPAEQTGLYSTFNQIFIVIGIIILYLIGEYAMPFVMCIYAAVSHGLQLGLIWLIPETAIHQEENKEENDAQEAEKESIFQAKYIWPLTVLILIMLLSNSRASMLFLPISPRSSQMLISKEFSLVSSQLLLLLLSLLPASSLVV